MGGVTERNPGTARGLMMRQYDKDRLSIAPHVNNEDTAQKEPQAPYTPDKGEGQQLPDTDFKDH